MSLLRIGDIVLAICCLVARMAAWSSEAVINGHLRSGRSIAQPQQIRRQAARGSLAIAPIQRLAAMITKVRYGAAKSASTIRTCVRLHVTYL